MYSPFVLPLTFFHCLVLYLIQSCSGQSLPLFTFARNLGRTRFWPLLFWGTTAIYIAMAWFWTLGERKEIFAALKGGGFVLRLSCVQKLLCAGRSMLRMYPWINPYPQAEQWELTATGAVLRSLYSWGSNKTSSWTVLLPHRPKPTVSKREGFPGWRILWCQVFPKEGLCVGSIFRPVWKVWRTVDWLGWVSAPDIRN